MSFLGNLATIISPVTEISAYEALWTKHSTVAKVAKIFRDHNHALPSRVAELEDISADDLNAIRIKLDALLPFTHYSALFYDDFEYPQRLKDAKHPLEVLYYQGNLDLLASRSVAVVGARKASDQGKRRAARLARLLVANNITVMSGLATGIDTAAHEAAIAAGGQTIAVIGTPLNQHYPRENRELQQQIARDFLLVSQVPFYWTSQQDYQVTRSFFPERNKTMSALSQATVIVEASETSGTLTQARAALAQGRRLFILNSCFETGLKWPYDFQERGAIRVVDGSEIIENLELETQIELRLDV